MPYGLPSFRMAKEDVGSEELFDEGNAMAIIVRDNARVDPDSATDQLSERQSRPTRVVGTSSNGNDGLPLRTRSRSAPRSHDGRLGASRSGSPTRASQQRRSTDRQPRPVVCILNSVTFGHGSVFINCFNVSKTFTHILIDVCV
jgi:hypothetical protein